MQFSFDEDQQAMRDAVRAWADDRLDLAHVADREGGPADQSTWRGLADLGVLGMLAEDPASGVGLVEAALVFEELGAHLVTGPVLWTTLAAAYVTGAADGAARVAGVDLAEHGGGPVVVEHAAECDALVVLRASAVELWSRDELPPSDDGVPLDPLTPVTVFESIGPGRQIGDADAARTIRLDGQVLSAAMLVGVAQGALDVAREYALEREQFGVPIGSFQAIKHLLADMYVRVELARAATQAASAIVADPRAGDPERAAATAKLLAGEAGIANGRWAVQVLGGMGFTWDMLPHYFLKRSWALEHVFGTASSHGASLGAALAAELAIPTVDR
jgi:alkylation response protein AidB-like acyl-CoA dehydrogenase